MAGHKPNNATAHFFYVLYAVTLITSCTKHVAPKKCGDNVCFPAPVSYANDIKPLIATYCVTNQGPGTGCHDAWIFDYSKVYSNIQVGDFGRVINDHSMPKIPNTFGIGPLSDEQIRKFQCWICDGAPNN